MVFAIFFRTHILSSFVFQDEVVERVKARLQEEGREARNLVAYSLPLQDPPHIEFGEMMACGLLTNTVSH